MGKSLFLLILLLQCNMVLSAQEPIRWEQSVKKVSAHEFDLSLMAILKRGWHIYAQRQPQDAIAIPTSFKFNADPTVTMEEGVKEKGKLEKFTSATLGISAWQYSDTVTFIQRVKTHSTKEINIEGQVTYQICTDRECRAPKTNPFNFPLKE